MTTNPRDYGLANPPEPCVPPKILHSVDDNCPNCGGETLFAIQVEMHPDQRTDALLKGSGDTVGTYVGCAACPYASPMMTRRKDK